ncbi:MAG: NAD-dependent succinate-semialdehyde dehydrogenase [Pseudomonadaceae bacterium]|nr:NAD-dependent succinate-semialdehyde dehydrogenase [Pseudomonadaceae bacterium]
MSKTSPEQRILKSVNPHNNEAIEEYAEHTDAEVRQRMEDAGRAFVDWSRVATEDRIPVLEGLITQLEQRNEEFAQLITSEMGKPITQSRKEVSKCASLCRYYSDNAEWFLSPVITNTSAKRASVLHRPLGVVLAIMPWNFPFWQAMRFTVPALVAGNSVLLKHARNVSGCALALEDLFSQLVDIPLFQTLLVSSERIESVIQDDQVAAVTFTGSTKAGAKVASLAGAAIKKSVLELGGSDPYVVLKDADVEEAANVCAQARLLNNGQSCIAAKRFIVEKAVVEEFSRCLKDAFNAQRVGNPIEDATDIGPLARPDLVQLLQNQVADALTDNTKLLVGSRCAEGNYYPPTILTDVEADNIAVREELFGPVAPVMNADNETHAVELANNSRYGLGAAIFSPDVEKAWRIATDQLQAGSVAVNGQVVSNPKLPFGGIKDSGYGRELGPQGILEFVNVKTVCEF